MSAKYYTILTETGKTKVANAAALGRQIKLTHLAIGDGNGSDYDPVESQTALRKENYRAPISNLGTDTQNPNWVIAEGMIPVDVGSWFVREVGLFDEDGDLFAIGKYPETYKPTLAEGTGRDLYIRFIMVVSNTETIDLKIDPTVAIATREYADQTSVKAIKKHGIASIKQSEIQTVLDLETGNTIFIRDLHGGSYWDVRENDRVLPNIAETAVTFDDELTIHLPDGRCLYFSDALNSSLIRNKNSDNYNRWFGRQRTRIDALYINCYGDSITFGQALADSANATNKIGVDTGFGDNSQHGHWQFDKSYPVVLSDALNRSMANTVHVSNRGYSGDRVVTSYMRHRVQPQVGISTVMLGVNDCLFSTSNGKNPDQISNEANPWGLNCYSVMLRRFLMREILRGNNAVVFGCVNYASLSGYDGTQVAAAKLTDVYNDAAASVAAELGVYFVDTRKDIINQYDLARFTQEGTHPGEFGHQVLGERFAALFVGHGYLRSMKVSSGSKLIANQAINSMNSETLMAPIPNSTSYSPPFHQSEPTVLSIPALSNGRLVFSVYCDAEDMIVYPSFIANPSTVTMELDGGAAQQEYLVDYPTYQDASFSQADSYPASVKQRTYSSQVKVNRRTVHYSDKSDMYLHITGRGWHTISFSADVGSKAFIDSLMFLSWDEVHKEITGLTASVVFDGTGGVSIKDAFNVGAVTDNGTGSYTIHFLNPMLHANYNLQPNGIVSGRKLVLATHYGTPQLTSASVKFISAAGMGAGADWQPADPNHASVAIFGGR